MVNSYVSKTCDKGVKGRRMLLCRVELCVTEMSASRQILMIYIRKRLFAPQRGGQEEADRLFATQRGGQEEADRLFAPQRGGQEKQLCYSPRSAANKRFHFIIRPAADYVTRHLIGQFL